MDIRRPERNNGADFNSIIKLLLHTATQTLVLSLGVGKGFFMGEM